MRWGTLVVLVLWFFTSGCGDDLTEDTNTISSLMVWKAEKLARQYQHDDLSLNGLKTLTRSQAEALAQHEGILTLDGLTNLPPDIADALAQHNGRISLNGLTNLTPDTAQALARNKNFLLLDGLTTLTPNVAYILALHKGDLSLDGLTTLTPNVANALARHKGRLSLNGLTEITSVPLVEKLGHRLQSNNLVEISEEVALSLKSIKDEGYLSLDGLTTLTPNVANALARHKGRLSLNGLTEITSVPLAEKLAEQSDFVDLSNLVEISQEVASTLAKYEGDLFLDGLTTLSPNVANALAQHKGWLSLNGLTTLTYDVAESLSRHQGELGLGVTTLEPQIASLLAMHRGDALYMRNLRGLQNGQLAGKLLDSWAYQVEAELTAMLFDRLETISEEAATEIASRKGVLLLNGLKTLTPRLAKILATHEGTLNLSGIEEISEETAEALSPHAGLLHLTGLVNISNSRVAKALAGHRRCILLSPTVDIASGARAILNDSPQLVGYGYGSSELSHALVKAWLRIARWLLKLMENENKDRNDSWDQRRDKEIKKWAKEIDALATIWADDSRTSYPLPTDSGFIELEKAGLFQVSPQFEKRLQDANEYDDLDQRLRDVFAVQQACGTTLPPIALILGPKFLLDYYPDDQLLNCPKTEIDFAVKEFVARVLEKFLKDVNEIIDVEYP